MRIEKMPFTVYDVMGYFLPGALLISGIFIIYGEFFGFFFIFNDYTSLKSIVFIVVLIISCYILGHIIAYLSSETIERFIGSTIGYPSSTLISRAESNSAQRDIIYDNIKNKLISPLFWLCNFIYAPVVFVFYLIYWGASIEFLTKPLSDVSICNLKKKIIKEFGIDIISDDGKSWFEIINHKVIYCNNTAFMRMYNYMTIYGFLRNSSLSVIMLSWFLLYALVHNVVGSSHKLYYVCNSSFFHSSVLLLIVLWACGFFLVVGFVKFFRRYSQEAIMAYIYGIPWTDGNRPFASMESAE